MAKLTKNISLLTKAILDDQAVAFPTETFFALGVNGTKPKNILKILNIKGRDKNNPISLLIKDPSQIYNYSTYIPIIAQDLMKKYWPGPLTVVIKLDKRMSNNITTPNGTVGFRIPNHKVALKLLNECSVPITGTSANISGTPPHKSPDDVMQNIGQKLKFIFNDHCGTKSTPSTVIDFTKTPYEIIREGYITFSEITNKFGKNIFCIKSR